MASIVSSAIGAGATLAAADSNYQAQRYASDKNYNAQIATNKANKEIVASTNQANLNLAKQQNEWNVAQWNRENEYNSPQQQVSRLMSAGLSSAAAAQAVAPNTASSIQSANLANQEAAQLQAPQVSAPQFDLSAIPNVVGMMREIMAFRKEKAQAETAETDSKMREGMLLTDMDVKKADTALKQQEYQNIMKSFPFTLRSLRYKAMSDKYLPEMNRVHIDQVNKMNEQVEANVKLARQQFGFLEQWNEKKIQHLTEEIRNLVQTRDNLIKQGKNIQLDTENKEKYGDILDNQKFQSKIESILKASGSPDDVSGRIGALIASGVVKPEFLDKMLLGTKDYIHQGRRWFGSDPFTRDFLDYYWDKGSKTKFLLTPNKLGFGIEFLDSLFGD